MAVTSIKIALVICGLATFVASDDDQIRKRRFHRIDLNNDGVLSREEFDAEFVALDADKNGAVTLDEMLVIDKQVPQEGFTFLDSLDGSVDGSIKKSTIPNYIRIKDTNGDGVLSFEEHFARV